MNWIVAKEGLKQWVHDVTGLQTFWKDEPRSYADAAYALVSIIGTIGKGTDGVRYEFDDSKPNGQELKPSVVGQREFTLSVEFRVLDQRTDRDADYHAERFRNRIRWPSSQKKHLELNVGFIRVQSKTNPNEAVDDRMESRVVLDLRFSTAIREMDEGDGSNIGYFDKAEIETTLKGGADGEPLVTTETYGVQDE